MNDASLILTKNAIIQKTKLLLEMLQYKMQDHLKTKLLWPTEVVTTLPKISRGENYRGLPYLMLDYPRYFNKENIFALRTMFWWANFFSSTLHLSGKYKKLYLQRIISAYEFLKTKGYFICVNENEWEHHFERNNFIQIKKFSKLSFKKQVTGSPFIKLAKNISLQQWEIAPEILLSHFKVMTAILAD